MANTVIQLKYSSITNKPPTLNVAEPAYSNVSGTLWIDDGTGVVAIGGVAYTTKIDNATSANTGNTLILRDVDGSFSANVVGADSIVVGSGTGGNIAGANTVYANYFFGDGSGLTGLVTELTFTGDSGGPNTLNLLTDTLTFNGASGITTTISGNEVIFDVDTTVVRSNTEMPGTAQHIQTDVQISGNLTVQGSTTYVNTSINQTTDSMIELAANNTVGDVLDIGFYGLHGNTETSGVDITGLVRNAGTSDYYLFDRVNVDDEAGVNANTLAQAFTTANSASLYVNKVLANQSLGNTEGGYSFSGTEGGLDTGMFSPADGELEFWSNGSRIVKANTNIVFFEQDLKLKNDATINNPNGLLELNPDETNNDDRYIVIDATAPDHIHLRAGGTIDNSTATLFLGGEENYVKVSDLEANVVIRTSNAHNWEFAANGKLVLANGTSIWDKTGSDYGFYVDPIRANNAVGGNVTAYNTITKEVVSTNVSIDNSGLTLANGTIISDGESGLFVDSLNGATTGNVVFYDVTTKEITYGAFNSSGLANGSFGWTVDGTTGALYSTNGTYIADSANSVVIGQHTDVTNSATGRVAIGEYAGQTSQQQHTVAIGSYAGYQNQQLSAIAIGENSGNTSQQFSAIAIGRWAGETTQGAKAVAIGRLAGANNQGGWAVALGHHAGQGQTTAQGQYAVAIGAYAGEMSQNSNSIIINASGSTLNAIESGLYVNPVRYVAIQDATYDGLTFYNSSTKEITYSYVLSGGSF